MKTHCFKSILFVLSAALLLCLADNAPAAVSDDPICGSVVKLSTEERGAPGGLTMVFVEYETYNEEGFSYTRKLPPGEHTFRIPPRGYDEDDSPNVYEQTLHNVFDGFVCLSFDPKTNEVVNLNPAG